MKKILLGAAILLSGTHAIAGPLDYNRINLTGHLLFNDNTDAQVINFTLNERIDNGFFYEINSSATFVESEDVKTLQGVWGYSFQADNVDFALSLDGTRAWLSSGGAETIKNYNAELTIPLASNLYIELDYRNTFLEDFKSEGYSLSLEGGREDGFQWELTTDPKADDENLVADFYIPTPRDGKWVIGFDLINSDDVTYGIHGGYHWLFGAAAPRKAAVAPAAATRDSKPVENEPEAVDPIAPERDDEFAEFVDKSDAEMDQLEAEAKAKEAEAEAKADEMEADKAEAEESFSDDAADESADDSSSEAPSSSSSNSAPAGEEYDEDLDFLFE